jgi:hypothetical protein
VIWLGGLTSGRMEKPARDILRKDDKREKEVKSPKDEKEGFLWTLPIDFQEIAINIWEWEGGLVPSCNFWDDFHIKPWISPSFQHLVTSLFHKW